MRSSQQLLRESADFKLCMACMMKCGCRNTCTVSHTQKRIRRDVYCEQLFSLDRKLQSMIPSMCLLRDLDCVNYYSDPGYLTPRQIMESIRLWHEDVVNFPSL